MRHHRAVRHGQKAQKSRESVFKADVKSGIVDGFYLFDRVHSPCARRGYVRVGKATKGIDEVRSPHGARAVGILRKESGAFVEIHIVPQVERITERIGRYFPTFGHFRHHGCRFIQPHQSREHLTAGPYTRLQARERRVQRQQITCLVIAEHVFVRSRFVMPA